MIMIVFIMKIMNDTDNYLMKSSISVSFVAEYSSDGFK